MIGRLYISKTLYSKSGVFIVGAKVLAQTGVYNPFREQAYIQKSHVFKTYSRVTCIKNPMVPITGRRSVRRRTVTGFRILPV